MVKSPLLTEKQHAVIQDAIKRAEKQTSGEIVIGIARQSGNYDKIELMVAMIVALAIPFLIHLTAAEQFSFNWLWSLQLSVFMLISLILRVTGLVIPLLPKNYLHGIVKRTAYENFFKNNLYETKNRAAIFIFVSLKEHQIELIADTGIHHKENSTVWDKITNDFIRELSATDLASAFKNSIDACASVLHRHFPAVEADSNELPDIIIE